MVVGKGGKRHCLVALGWPIRWKISVGKSRETKPPAHRENREKLHSTRGAHRQPSTPYCQAWAGKWGFIVLKDFLVQTRLLKRTQ